MYVGTIWERVCGSGLRTRKSLVEISAALLIVAFVLALAGCGGGGIDEIIVVRPDPFTHADTDVTPTPTPTPTPIDPASFLNTPRFTTHQPDVLEQIGAHHAYARELTGKGVRIGIDDSIVDYTQSAEFGNRVKLTDADGAVLYYSRPDGEDLLRRNPNVPIVR